MNAAPLCPTVSDTGGLLADVSLAGVELEGRGDGVGLTSDSWVAEDGVFPMTYQQDNLGLYQKAAWWDHDQLRFRPKLQADLAKFANQWTTNIKEQQFGE